MAKKITPVKRQKADDRSVVIFMAPFIDLNWLPGVTRRTISDVKHENRWNRGVIYDDAGQPAVVLANVVDDLDEIFLQETLWKWDGRSSFTVDHRSVITTAFARLS